MTERVKPTLERKYKEEIVPAMREKFGIKNVMAIPRLEKIVVNCGVGEAIHDNRILDTVIEEISTITGQRPAIRKAKKAISNFKLREGMAVGCKVTLRRAKMYEFADRFINMAIPRIRDFNGVSLKSFDQKGNYTLGINDQAIFPEIDTGKMTRTQGMDISFVFNHGPREHTEEILRLLGMPFVKSRQLEESE